MRASKLFVLTDEKEEGPIRLLLGLWLTTVLFLVGVALVAEIALKSAKTPVYDDAFYRQFCLLKAAFYTGQPAKNAAYLAVCLASPFLLGGSFFLSRFLMERIPRSRLRLFFRCANLANGFFLIWSLSAIVSCPVPAMSAELPEWLLYKWFFQDESFFTFARFVFLAIALGLGVFFYGRPPSSKNRNLAFLVVVGSWLLVAISRIYVPVEINDEWRFTHHLNPLVFGLSQAMDGHHYLVDFPHRYGGYVEFLAPILAWFPRRVETILILFSALNLITMACLLWTLRQLIRSPLQLLLAGWSLLGILAVDQGDNYYQNTVVRGLFPTVALLLAIGYLRRPGLLLYALVSVLAAVAPLWNQDSGMVLWLGLTATLVVRDITERSFRSIGWHLAMQLLLLTGAAATFLLYLRISSGLWPDLGLLFASQQVFIGRGYFCLRMLVPDAWMLVVAIYAMALSAVVVFYRRGTFSWRTHALFMISLMGISFFSYFMGRSAESNLVSAAFLVPLLLGLVLSETRGLIRLRQLPRQAWVLLVPATTIQVWWALLFVLAVPNLVERSAKTLADSRLDASTTPFGRNAAFVQSHAAAKENLYILSDQAGFYYYLSNTVSDIDLASTDEFVWTKDIDRLVSAIDSRLIPKLFVDRNFFETRIYKDEVYDRINQAIADNYRAEASSPGDRVTLYVPRDGIAR